MVVIQTSSPFSGTIHKVVHTAVSQYHLQARCGFLELTTNMTNLATRYILSQHLLQLELMRLELVDSQILLNFVIEETAMMKETMLMRPMWHLENHQKCSTTQAYRIGHYLHLQVVRA